MGMMTMDAQTIERLCRINNEFYRNQCESFSQTRTQPWNGWYRCADVIDKVLISANVSSLDIDSLNLTVSDAVTTAAIATATTAVDATGSDVASFASGNAHHAHAAARLSVLDLACGNLRFEQFLTQSFPEVELGCCVVDNCDDLCCDLAASLPFVRYQNLDILDVLMQNDTINDHLDASPCDLSVSFGFMHHVPGFALREKVLRSLIKQTRTGGLIIISFWQFLNSRSLADKAQATHERGLKELDLAGLEEGDYLIGWKDKPDAYRYCHSFSDNEIDQLIDVVASDTILVDRFSADGRTDNLNTYLILQKR
jgi:SAM-dependent methyltransferase